MPPRERGRAGGPGGDVPEGAHQLVTRSDLVFDGQSAPPYVESDPVCPLNTHGRINVEAERRVLAFAPSALVIRAGALFLHSDTAR